MPTNPGTFGLIRRKVAFHCLSIRMVVGETILEVFLAVRMGVGENMLEGFLAVRTVVWGEHFGRPYACTYVRTYVCMYVRAGSSPRTGAASMK